MRPTSMLYRNLMSIDVEESIRANPLDAVVLLGGCDKTTPAQLMGSASVDVPAIMLTGGPLLTGRYRGQAIGSGTDIWRYTEMARAGAIDQAELDEVEAAMTRSAGHCMTMGTASTMACLSEVLGFAPSASAAIPASDVRRLAMAERVGGMAVNLAASPIRPSDLITRASLRNAVVANAALGGSTNAVLHLLALAGRVEVPFDLHDFDMWSRDIPLLANIEPSGQYHMEDFFYAGGVPALLNQLADHLDLTCPTVEGITLGERLDHVEVHDADVIRTIAMPLQPAGSGTAVLFGNLAPDGAVIKVSAADPKLLHHSGRAIVFESIESYLSQAADPEFDPDPTAILVLRNAGPVGYPGMPEVGNLPLPVATLRRGVHDMVRISDARASGTAYGTLVLHVAPEARAGGTLDLVQEGDVITLDVSRRRLELDVSAAELEDRRALSLSATGTSARGWSWLYRQHVLQANRGADLDFLVGSSGAGVPRRHF